MEKENFAIVIHGGAGDDSAYIQQHQEEYKKGIQTALDIGYKVLAEQGTAVQAVEEAIRSLEDNPLFNAGKGAALNELAKVEMCSSIMDGKKMKCGAAAIVRNVRNPISLSSTIMQHSAHLYLADNGAKEYAEDMQLAMEPDAYFITEQSYSQYKTKWEEVRAGGKVTGMRGTVGAVALDSFGNLAAGTSTGGTECCKNGRIGDSSMIGAGTYANGTCAISASGDGEYNILYSTAFHINALVEYNNMNVQQAAHYLIHEKLQHLDADMGIIGIDKDGRIAAEFNTERMHRGWRSSEGGNGCFVYKE